MTNFVYSLLIKLKTILKHKKKSVETFRVTGSVELRLEFRSWETIL